MREQDKQVSTTIATLRPERERRERTNSAIVDNNCTEFVRSKSTESTAIHLVNGTRSRFNFGWGKISRESLVKSRKFNKKDLKLFRHSELGSESIPHRKLTVLAGKILKPSWIMRLCPKAWFWASYGLRFAHPTANPLQDDSYSNNHNELSTNDYLLTTKAFGFTMAEILLSLTIIGVVAAITLPSLTGNINERTWNTQRKALYARMSQAISLMPALNNYGTTGSNATETFLTAGLSKVLKVNNICANDKLADCGIVSEITNMAGTKMSVPKTLYELNEHYSRTAFTGPDGVYGYYSGGDADAAAFETQNGENIIAYYNRTCSTDYRDFATYTSGVAYGIPVKTACVNFIYDLNGKKGPNTVGKDIGFMTVFNSVDSIVVAPMPSGNAQYEGSGVTWYNASTTCTTNDSESRIPNIDELGSMVINKSLVNLQENSFYWSGTSVSATRAWWVGVTFGARFTSNKGSDDRMYVRCVKR